MSQGTFWRHFTEILAVEWQKVLDQSWNSERFLVFAHAILTKTLGGCRAKDIRSCISSLMDLWKKGIYYGLVGDA